MSIKCRYFYLIIAFIAAFAGILFGFDTGVISGAILFIRDEYHLSAQMNGIVTGAVLVGAFIGAICSGRLSDYFGRRKLLIADAIIFIVGTLLTVIAPSVFVLIASRIIVGVAIGIASYTAPLYISEIAPPNFRGALVSLNQLTVTVGIFLSYIVDFIFAHLASHDHSWRYMFAAGIIPAAILLVGVLLLPFSPRWLMSKGYESRALETLHKIRGNEDNAHFELRKIKASLLFQSGDWKILFSKMIQPTLLIAGGLAIIQQVTGINTILYYAPTIFQMAGFHQASVAILATAGVGAVFVLATAFALPFIDLWGRRPLLLVGLTTMIVSLLVLSYAFHANTATPLIHTLAVLSIFVYVIGFAISLGPIMWLMIAEIFPLRIRGFGSSVATAINWGSNFLVTVSFLTLVQWVHQYGAFLIYAIVGVFSLLFIYYLVPETRGITLEKIEENLNAGKRLRYLGDH